MITREGNVIGVSVVMGRPITRGSGVTGVTAVIRASRRQNTWIFQVRRARLALMAAEAGGVMGGRVLTDGRARQQ